MKVIRAEVKHLDSLVELFDAYRVWYRQSSDKPQAKSFLEKRIANKESIIFCCEDSKKKLLGFTQLYPMFSSTRMKRMWLLNDLYVQPDSRGKGISKLLINAAKALAKDTNAAGVLLETEKNNTIGNILYQSMNFELEANNFYFWTNK